MALIAISAMVSGHTTRRMIRLLADDWTKIKWTFHNKKLTSIVDLGDYESLDSICSKGLIKASKDQGAEP